MFLWLRPLFRPCLSLYIYNVYNLVISTSFLLQMELPDLERWLAIYLYIYTCTHAHTHIYIYTFIYVFTLNMSTSFSFIALPRRNYLIRNGGWRSQSAWWALSIYISIHLYISIYPYLYLYLYKLINPYGHRFCCRRSYPIRNGGLRSL